MPIDLGLLLGWLALSATLSAIPGPSVILATSRAIAGSRLTAMQVVAGNAIGGLMLVLLVVAGLGALLLASATAFTVVKIAGACYLAYLGVRAIWRARRAGIAEIEPVRSERPLRAGLLVGISNPKSLIGLGAMLPQFTDPALGSVAVQMLLLGLAGLVTQIAIESVWVALAGTLRVWFAASRRRVAMLHASGGVLMLAFAARLGLARQPA